MRPKLQIIIPSVFLLLSFLMVSPVIADEGTQISVQFQTLGLTTQDYIIFDDGGNDISHSNTSSTVTLDYNESTFYTIQMQPSVTNMEPTTMYGNIFDFIMSNYIALFLVIALIIAITRK